MYLDEKQIQLVRDKMQGIVGGSFYAQWAEDADISRLVELSDKIAELHNCTIPIKEEIEIIQKRIRNDK